MAQVSDIARTPHEYVRLTGYSRLQPSSAENLAPSGTTTSSPTTIAHDRYEPANADPSAGLVTYQPANKNYVDGSSKQRSTEITSDVVYDDIFVKKSDGTGKDSTSIMPKECKTWSSRTYQDGSGDPGVSFKTPTHVSPGAAPSAVLGHELEHVRRNQAKAEQEDKVVVMQSVSIHNAICPECGLSYVSGGTTTTVTKDKPAPQVSEERLYLSV